MRIILDLGIKDVEGPKLSIIKPNYCDVDQNTINYNKAIETILDSLSAYGSHTREYKIDGIAHWSYLFYDEIKLMEAVSLLRELHDEMVPTE